MKQINSTLPLPWVKEGYEAIVRRRTLPSASLNKQFVKFRNFASDVVVGIDEAGRGPVLGYLVYGVLVSPIADLRNYEFMDSKRLEVGTRERQFKLIDQNLGYGYIALHPQYITECMSSSERKNLDEISYETVRELISLVALEYGSKIKCIYVDSVGSSEEEISINLPDNFECRVKMRYKADAKYKIVGGASIVAKVTRDKLLHDLVPDAGSGYPADPRTIDWLRRNFNPVFGYENFVRFPWKTISRYLIPRKSKEMKGRFKGFYRLPT